MCNLNIHLLTKAVWKAAAMNLWKFAEVHEKNEYAARHINCFPTGLFKFTIAKIENRTLKSLFLKYLF